MGKFKLFPGKPGRYGSAYLIAITIVAVLVIMVMAFSSSKTARRWTTRLLSDEQKAEALANSAVELALRDVKDNMNVFTGETPEIYSHFRLPAKVKGGILTSQCLGTGSGDDAELELSDETTWKPVEMDLTKGVLQSLDDTIQKMGGINTHVELTVKSGISWGAAITAKNPDYPVVGVSVKAKTPHSNEAQFLDSISNAAAGGTKSLQGNLIGPFYLDFTLPNQTQPAPPTHPPLSGNDSHGFEVSIPLLPDLHGTATLTKTGVGLIHYRVEVASFDMEGDFNINDFVNDYLGTTGTPISLKEFLKLCASNADASVTWNANRFFSEAKNRFSNAADVAPIKAVADSLGDPFSGPVVVEKTGLLRIEVDVLFKPQGDSGKKKIHRRLFAEREFKVSDVQPPAPEYALFIANSTKITESPDSISSGDLVSAIDFRCGVATFAVHNIPPDPSSTSIPPSPKKFKYEDLTGLSPSGNSDYSLPGLIRINSSGKMNMNTFLGTLDEVTSSELNGIFGDGVDPSMAKCGVVSFQWTDRSPPRPFGFALVRNTPLTKTITKFENLKSLLSFCDALSAPTLLTGNGFFEYGLSLKPEAFLDKRYSTLDIKILPKAVVAEDNTEIDIKYEIFEEAYGLPGLPAHTGAAEWNPGDADCMPPNLYSALQYAKKATYFYTSESDFWNDTKRFDGGVFNAQGVTYIKDDLTLDSTKCSGMGGKFKVKGKGILVAKFGISLETDVERVDTDTTFSLIARLGWLDFKAGCSSVQASCYSHKAPINAPGRTVVINGNLVTNQFKRERADGIQIQYNSRACRVTPLSVIRDVGKFDPLRYHVSLGNRWARFEFQKN